MDVKLEIYYLLIVDYLTRMAEDRIITADELENAKRLAAIQYGIKSVSE